MIENTVSQLTAAAAPIGRTFVFVVTTCLFAAATHAEESPASFLSLHPDNPHYLLWRGERTILVTSGEHYGVKVSIAEEQRLVAWIDALCPYNGLEELLSRPDPDPA